MEALVTAVVYGDGYSKNYNEVIHIHSLEFISRRIICAGQCVIFFVSFFNYPPMPRVPSNNPDTAEPKVSRGKIKKYARL